MLSTDKNTIKMVYYPIYTQDYAPDFKIYQNNDLNDKQQLMNYVSQL